MKIDWTDEAYPEETAEFLIEYSNGDDVAEIAANNDMAISDVASIDGDSDGGDDKIIFKQGHSCN